VEDHLLARLELVQARAQVLGAGTLSYADGADAVGRHLEGIVQVADPRSVRCALKMRRLLLQTERKTQFIDI